MSINRLITMDVIKNTTASHTATVFLFHGSGSTSREFRYGIKALLRREFSFPHIKVVFPTAPLRPYSPLDGELSHVWFDRLAVDSSVPEDLDSIEDIGKDIKQLIKEENDRGIPSSRIIVGGHSMGGALALYTGYKWDTSLAGVFSISAFLNNGSDVYKNLEKNPGNTPELLQYHGAKDDLVPLKSARDTFHQLSSRGVKGNFIVDPDTEHYCSPNELLGVYKWINSKLPAL